MRLVSRSGHVEENAVEMFTCSLLFKSKIPSPFRENNNMVVFPFPFLIFMSLANLWLICLQKEFPILRARSFADLYPIIFPPRRPMVLGRGWTFIPGLIRSPPTLVIFGVAHSSLLKWVMQNAFKLFLVYRLVTYFIFKHLLYLYFLMTLAWNWHSSKTKRSYSIVGVRLL